MKFKGTKLSKRTLALLAAAVVLLGGSGFTGTRAALNVIGPNYDATIATNSISVALTEDGKAIANNAELYKSLDGKAEPGKTYADSIGVINDGAAPEYVRVIVRKYWLTPEGEEVQPAEGEAAATGGEKDKALNPDMIKLALANDSWIEKNGGSAETKIYYLKNQLTGTADLFKSIQIDKSVATDKKIILNGTTEISEADIASVTSGTITYVYKYNGYKFCVDAEVQSVQTHNAADAIKSVWGVTATVSGETITAIN